MADEQFIGAQDSGSTASHFNALSFIAEQSVKGLVTVATIGMIKTAPYDRNGNPIVLGTIGAIGFVDVMPMVNQINGDGKKSQPHDIINGLPYFRYQGGKNAIIMDPQLGDLGIILSADRDISQVKKNAAQGNPGSFRTFDRADGIFIGLCVSTAVPDQGLVFTSDGMKLFDKNGNTLTFSPNGIDAVATRLTNTGEITRGLGTGDQVTLGQHLHKNSGGTGNSGTPNAGT